MAAHIDLPCDQGADFRKVMGVLNPDGSPKNITGASATMQVRPWANSPTLIVSLSTTNGRLSINGAAGLITMTLTAAVTAGLAAGSYAYDIEMTLAGVTERLSQGNFVIDPNVTV